MINWLKRFDSSRRRRREARKLGLALGGGGVRGLAHVGVLSVFDREGIPISALAGSSMGAIVAATYTLNPNFSRELLINTTLELSSSLSARLTMAPANGNSFLDRVRRFMDVERYLVENLWGWSVLPGSIAAETLEKLTLGKNLNEARTPVAIVAVDLLSGEKVVFTEGPASLAVQASSAIPCFLPPVHWEHRLLADGAIIDFVPAGVVKEMGVDLVVAVDVDQEKEWAEVHNGLEVFLRAIEICSRHHKHHHLESADMVIRIEFGEPVHTFDISKAELCINAGERAAKTALPEIRKLLIRGRDASEAKRTQGGR